LKDARKLVVYSLEDHPAAFQRLECALSLLDKAHSGDLQSATPLSPSIIAAG